MPNMSNTQDAGNMKGQMPMSSENQMRKSGVNNINFGHNGGQQHPPMSPDNVSQPMGTMVNKR